MISVFKCKIFKVYLKYIFNSYTLAQLNVTLDQKKNSNKVFYIIWKLNE